MYKRIGLGIFIGVIISTNIASLVYGFTKGIKNGKMFMKEKGSLMIFKDGSTMVSFDKQHLNSVKDRDKIVIKVEKIDRNPDIVDDSQY